MADVSFRSPLLRDVSQGGTSVSPWQKFYTDDVNQCLHNKSGSHGVPNANLFNFTFLLVDFGKVLCSSANELQQNSNATFREDSIPQILTVLLEIHHVYIWPLRPFVFCLSFVNNSLRQWNYVIDQLALLTGFRTDFASSVWNFCRSVADVPPRETSLNGDERGETSAIPRLTRISWINNWWHPSKSLYVLLNISLLVGLCDSKIWMLWRRLLRSSHKSSEPFFKGVCHMLPLPAMPSGSKTIGVMPINSPTGNTHPLCSNSARPFKCVSFQS